MKVCIGNITDALKKACSPKLIATELLQVGAEVLCIHPGEKAPQDAANMLGALIGLAGQRVKGTQLRQQVNSCRRHRAAFGRLNLKF